MNSHKSRPMRVLVVDDSAFNRQTIVTLLDRCKDVQVVGRANNGESALKESFRLKPDLITLDLEMPGMDGFTFLRILMNKQPTPVIVVSSHSHQNNVFKALELGALDFISKPTNQISAELVSIGDELVEKIAMVRMLKKPMARVSMEQTGSVKKPNSVDALYQGGSVVPKAIVVIGASTGGPPALQSLFLRLPWQLPLAYLVAQHMPPKFTRAFADRLDRSVGLTVREASGGEVIEAGMVFVAPGGFHMRVKKQGDFYMTEINETSDAKYIPSIDVLFESAAVAVGKNLAGVILTGMGNDGKMGIEAIKRNGGLTIAESEQSAVIFGMPREAIASGMVDSVLHLDLIAERLVRFVKSLDE